MNNFNPAVRKVIYIVAIAFLIIPLSFVSKPETRDKSGAILSGGGQLSMLREQYDLSQAKLSEIDPASETMKLASLGLRGVAVSTLWMQAMEHKKKEEYDQLASTLKALTKIQPNFVKVWEFQAHNLAYNVSMEFDDYEYRYHWVKKGIDFLKEGVPYNKTDHRMTDNLGMFTGQKMGKSDEKDSFRRMFRQDSDFHREMSDYIDPESYETLGYGYDSWKMAWQWYDYSRSLVEEKSCPKRSKDMLFYMYRPSQVRNQGLSLQNEFRTGDTIQEVWRTAQDEWADYGDETMFNSLGVEYTMEGIAKYEKQLEAYRAQLDELAPNVRNEFVEQIKSTLNFPEEAMLAWKMPSDQRNDEQNALARRVNAELIGADENLDARIAQSAPEADQLNARRLVNDINKVLRQIQTSDKDASTINYAFWKARTAAESSDAGVRARDALYEADEMRRRSIFDDEFDRDYKTKEITITKRGAISLYLDAFEKWHEVFEQNQSLRTGPLSDDLKTEMEKFKAMLATTNREWPDDFPLQDLIDVRAADGERDGLPTSDELEEQRSGISKSSDEKEKNSVIPEDWRKKDDDAAKMPLAPGEMLRAINPNPAIVPEPEDSPAPVKKPDSTENKKEDPDK